MNKKIELKEIKQKYTNFINFISIKGYQNLFGIQIFKSGRKHIKEEHVYYCYTPNNFDYSVYKNFVNEVRAYEKSKDYEFRKNYNLLRYEIYGDLYLYQLCSASQEQQYNFHKIRDLKFDLSC